MRVALLVSWYDERPEWLAAVVAGFGRVADEVVAVDGAYAFYPGADAAPRSHPAQAEAVLAAAESIGVGCTVHRPRWAFAGNEVEKRNLSFRLAGALEPDWVVAADGDYLPRVVDPEGMRGALESTDLNVASYALEDETDGEPWSLAMRDVFRWAPDLRYDRAHHTVRGTYAGRLETLRGPRADVDALDLRGALVAVHRNRARPAERQHDAQRYYAARDAAGIESEATCAV
jgi:hypothetical protein